MSIRKRRSDRSGRAPLLSPGRPPVAGRDERRRFWLAIARGMSSEDAAVEAGVSQPVRNQMVPKGRRHAPGDVQILGQAPFRAIPVAAGARGDCASAGPGPFHAGDRAPARPICLDDLPGAAAQRSHPQRWSRVSRDNRPVARRAIGPAPEANEACPQRDLAHLCRGEAGRCCRCSERCSCSGSCRRLEGPPAWAAAGSAMGQGLEPGTDCSTPAD